MSHSTPTKSPTLPATITVPQRVAMAPPTTSSSSSSSSSSTTTLSNSTSLQDLYPAPTPPLHPETPHGLNSPQATYPSLSPEPIFRDQEQQTVHRSSSSHIKPQQQHPVANTNNVTPNGSQDASRTTSPPLPVRIAWRRKLVLVLVGLPARGKSYIAYKLLGYLRWRGLNASLFNVGKHRRHVAEKLATSQSADFFSADNVKAKTQRDEIAMEVLECMLDWLGGGGDVSIFDATNTTAARRKAVLNKVHARSNELRCIFLESICDDARVLEANYHVKVSNSPDYKGMTLADALADLKMRVANYEKVYESINDDELSYIKLHNLASKVVANKIHGALAHQVLAYLMSIHIVQRPIYFVRAGHSESDRDVVGQQYQDRQILKPFTGVSDVPNSALPADFHIPYTVAMAANLDHRGVSFASRLNQFMSLKMEEFQEKLRVEKEQLKASPSFTTSTLADRATTATSASAAASSSLSAPVPGPPSLLSSSSSGVYDANHLPLIVYTSTLPRAIQTVAELKDHASNFEPQSALNMMDTGVCSGMSIDEIREKMPQELEKWQRHKYRYRFPGGESQADRAKSLEPLVFELERQTLPVLVVSHMSTLQVLLGFFYGSKRSVDSYYSLWIPQHTVLELIPHQYGWKEVRHDLSEEACAEAEHERALEAQGAASTPGSPLHTLHHHVSVPVELGANPSDEELERFNLQVVKLDQAKKVAQKASSQAMANLQSDDAQATSASASSNSAASSSSSSSLSAPRNLSQHDRSISIPPVQPAISPPPEMKVGVQRKVSSGNGRPLANIGKSSSAKVLGGDFYNEEAGE